jgi:hypothetical protein
MEYFNSGAKIEALERSISKIDSKLNEVDNLIRQLYSRIR